MANAPAEGHDTSDSSIHPVRGTPGFERDVRRMFASISSHYEAFNHLATFGQDFVWRERALWQLDRFRRGPVARALDVGSGTGEFARAVARRYPRATVVATDVTAEMVRRARGVRASDSVRDREEFGRATALRLPFADASFDLVTNAFVLRNLLSLEAGLAEMRRVLRPGGVLLSLEVGEPPSPAVGSVFHAHFDRVVPMIGRVFGAEGPYRYLPESLRYLPARERILTMHGAAGFGRRTTNDQSFGIVVSYLAEAGSDAGRSG